LIKFPQFSGIKNPESKDLETVTGFHSKFCATVDAVAVNGILITFVAVGIDWSTFFEGLSNMKNTSENIFMDFSVHFGKLSREVQLI